MDLGDDPERIHAFMGAVAGRKEAATGFEPMNSDFADRCLTTWLRRRTPFRITVNQVTGAGNGIRTRDINLGKVTLYH